MKRKQRGIKGPKVVKTSISLPDILIEFGERQVQEEGHNSFSAYLAHLIRLDRDKIQRRGPRRKDRANPGAKRSTDGDLVREMSKRATLKGLSSHERAPADAELEDISGKDGSALPGAHAPSSPSEPAPRSSQSKAAGLPLKRKRSPRNAHKLEPPSP